MLGISRRSALGACFALVACLTLTASRQAFHSQLPSSSSPTPAATEQLTSTAFIRGAYGKDSSEIGYGVMAANGFNSVMTGPYRELLDPLAGEGLKAVVWLGNFRNPPISPFPSTYASIPKLVPA